MTVTGLGGDQAAMGRHFVAVSTNLERGHGIRPTRSTMCAASISGGAVR